MRKRDRKQYPTANDVIRGQRALASIAPSAEQAAEGLRRFGRLCSDAGGHIPKHDRGR